MTPQMWVDLICYGAAIVGFLALPILALIIKDF